MSEVIVALVVDPSFGSQLLPLAEWAHVWVCASPVNESCIRALWAKVEARHLATLFQVNSAATPAEQALTELEDLDLHHPDWSVLEIYGAELAPSLAAALQEMGAAEFYSFAGGFRAQRSATSARSKANGMLAQS